MLGVRLFNVSSMLSNRGSAPNGSIFVQLVNYSEYGVEMLRSNALGKFKKAHLYMPGGMRMRRRRRMGPVWISIR